MAISKADVVAVATALAQAAGHTDPDTYAAHVAECFDKPEVYKAKLKDAADEQAALTAEAIAAAQAASAE